MTSESDSPPHRRPPTIDLTATEVQTPAPDAGAGNPAEDRAAENAGKSAKSSGRATSYAAGALLGVIVMGAIGAGLWYAGYVPSREAALPPSAAAPDNTLADEISARLKKLEGAFRAQQPDPALAARLTAAEAATKSVGDSLAALTRRVDEIAANAQSALIQAKAATAAADAAKGAGQNDVRRSDLDAVAKRIAALESTVKSLSSEVASRPASADDVAARATVAAEALRAAVERGAPYQSELSLVKSLGADKAATAPLEPFAADGIPSAAALASELATLTPALREASGPAPTENSIFERLKANAKELVRITPADAPAGDDPSSVIARINADAARADIAAALADIDKLPAPAKAAAQPWVEKAGARDAAIAASRQIAADALAAIGKPAPQ